MLKRQSWMNDDLNGDYNTTIGLLQSSLFKSLTIGHLSSTARKPSI